MTRYYEAEFDDGIGCIGGMIVTYNSDYRNGSKGNLEDAIRAAKRKYGKSACRNLTLVYSHLVKD